MTGSVNRVHLSGHLGADPRVNTLSDGTRIARFPLATSESWTDGRSGKRVGRTRWHAVVIWNQFLVRLAADRLRRGTGIYLEGKLETRRYTDRNGTRQYITEVVIRPRGGTFFILSGTSVPSNTGRPAMTAGPSAPAPAATLPVDPVNAPLDHAGGHVGDHAEAFGRR